MTGPAKPSSTKLPRSLPLARVTSPAAADDPNVRLPRNMRDGTLPPTLKGRVGQRSVVDRNAVDRLDVDQAVGQHRDLDVDGDCSGSGRSRPRPLGEADRVVVGGPGIVQRGRRTSGRACRCRSRWRPRRRSRRRSPRRGPARAGADVREHEGRGGVRRPVDAAHACRGVVAAEGDHRGLRVLALASSRAGTSPGPGLPAVSSADVRVKAIV